MDTCAGRVTTRVNFKCAAQHRAAARPTNVRAVLSAPASLQREELVALHVHQLKGAPTTARDTRQRVIGNMHMQAGLLRQQLVQIS